MLENRKHNLYEIEAEIFSNRNNMKSFWINISTSLF